MSVNHVVNGMFIMDGIREVAGVQELLAHTPNHLGWVEWVNEVAEFGIYLEQVYEACYNLRQGLPGVFDYEVTIEFGKWIATEIIEGRGLPSKEVGQAQIDELVMDFMKC